jgi:hypothetical protein
MQSVTMTFTGDATHLQETMEKVVNGLNGVKTTAKETSAATVASGVLMADAFKKVATEAFQLAKSALNAFGSTAEQTRALQRTLGGTAEDMSHLGYAANQLGIDTDTLSRSTVMLFGHLLKNDDAAKRLGVSIYEAGGAIKPTTQLLGEIGDKLNQVSDSQERATLTRELFGKNGAAMLDMLRQGGAGMQEFAKQADELGLTLSQKDVNASYQFTLASREMHASLQGIGIQIGRTLLPVMKALVDDVRHAVEWFRHMWTEGGTASTVLKVIVGVIGAFVAAAVLGTAATMAWTAAVAVFEVLSSPITLVLLAVVALAAGFIALVKNFKPVGEAVEILGGIIGTAIGWGISIALKAIKGMIDGLASMLDAGLRVAGAFASLADAVAGFFGFDTGLSDKVNAVRTGLGSITTVIDKTLDDWSKTAKDKGGSVGLAIGNGLVQAINDLHMPTMGNLGAGGNPYAGSGDFQPDFTSGGGKGAIDQRKKAVQDFFKQLIDSSRAGLNELRQNAIDARRQLADTAKNVAKSIADSFSISDITESSFAAYNGVDRLTASFNRRLATMSEFVRNIRKLMGLGLPMTMLVDMVNAGPDKGGAAAKLLAENPQSIADFKAIQASIDEQSSSLGQMIGQAQYGGLVESTSAAAAAGQAQFKGYLGQAANSGFYTPTAEDLSAANGDVYTEITINVAATEATPEEIASAVAFAAKTSSPVPAKAKKKRTAAAAKRASHMTSGM